MKYKSQKYYFFQTDFHIKIVNFYSKMFKEINNRLGSAYQTTLAKHNSEYHLFGLYTIMGMVLLFIMCSTFWNMYIYGVARINGTAVSILAKKNANDPLKGKNMVVRMALYATVSIFVLPLYFLPKIIAEVIVEAVWKSVDNLINLIPNIGKFFNNYLLPAVRRMVKTFILKIVDILLFVYQRLVDAYVELRFLYEIFVHVFVVCKDYILYVKDVIVDICCRMINYCYGVWTSMVNYFFD